MEEFLQTIRESALFEGMSSDEISSALKCLLASARDYRKGELVLRAGDEVSSVRMVLAGSVHIIKEDFWGNRNILSGVGPGELFAETYACVKGERLGVSAVANEPAKVLLLDISRILSPCSSACEFHARLIRNLLSVLAEKNLMMTRKLAHVTQRTTREKLLSYLSAEAQRRGGAAFEIPFNRQQLADYLSVDRSAMSFELGKMRDEGLLTFQKNSFVLKSEPQ